MVLSLSLLSFFLLPLPPAGAPVADGLVFDGQVNIGESMNIKMAECLHPRAKPNHFAMPENQEFCQPESTLSR